MLIFRVLGCMVQNEYQVANHSTIHAYFPITYSEIFDLLK